MGDTSNENAEFQAFLEELKNTYDKVEIELFKKCSEIIRGKYIYLYIQSEISRNFEKLVMKNFLTPDEIDQFYRENIRLVNKLETKYAYLYRNDKMEHSMLDIDREDVYGACMIGLTKAANTFDKGRFVKFSSYAYTCMENECKTLAKKVSNSRKYLEKPIYSGDLSYSSYVDSDNNEEDSILNRIEDEKIAEQFKRAEVLSSLDSAINSLVERKQGIIRDYFGLNEEGVNMTQVEVAVKYGFSQPRIKSLISESIEELKLYFNKKGIYDFSSIFPL